MCPPQAPCRGVLLGGGTEPGGVLSLAFHADILGLAGRQQTPVASWASSLPSAENPSSSFFSLACLGPFPKVRDTFRPILQLLLPPRKLGFAGCYAQNGLQGYSWVTLDYTVDKSLRLTNLLVFPPVNQTMIILDSTQA